MLANTSTLQVLQSRSVFPFIIIIIIDFFLRSGQLDFSKASLLSKNQAGLAPGLGCASQN